jgi:2-dehydro-3-deoxyphosphogluconate aldolase/(4S)-4-hydroxy-2-oxoglutarate aldolase
VRDVSKEGLLKRIGEEWLAMIMRGDGPEETEAACDALVAGGAVLVEVPFTVPDAAKVIRRLRDRHGDRVLLSAGTVLTVEQVDEAIAAGAEAIVSPNLHPPVVEATLRRGAVSIPGCVTPTEIADALRLGADIIKLFPCYNLGPEYVGFICGPFPGTRILPAGRVTLENMDAWVAAGAFAGVVGVTTEMGLLSAVKARNWAAVSLTARKFADRAREVLAGRRGKGGS